MTRAERFRLEPNAIQEPLDRLEGGIMQHISPEEIEVSHSIAISLKRIADALERFDSTMANWSTRNI